MWDGTHIFDQEDLDDSTQGEVPDNVNGGNFIDKVLELSANQKHMMTWIKTCHRDLKALADRFDGFVTEFRALNPTPDSQVLVDLSELKDYHSVSPCNGRLKQPEPFVSVTVDGILHNLFLDNSSVNGILSTKVRREAARIVIIARHEIKDLRRMTRTGTTKRKLNEHDEPDKFEALPRETMLFVEEVWRKFFPSPTLSNPTVEQLMEQEKKFKSELNRTVAGILQYYKDEYGEDGKIIPKKRKIGTVDSQQSQSKD